MGARLPNYNAGFQNKRPRKEAIIWLASIGVLCYTVRTVDRYNAERLSKSAHREPALLRLQSVYTDTPRASTQRTFKPQPTWSQATPQAHTLQSITNLSFCHPTIHTYSPKCWQRRWSTGCTWQTPSPLLASPFTRLQFMDLLSVLSTGHTLQHYGP